MVLDWKSGPNQGPGLHSRISLKSLFDGCEYHSFGQVELIFHVAKEDTEEGL